MGVGVEYPAARTPRVMGSGSPSEAKDIDSPVVWDAGTARMGSTPAFMGRLGAGRAPRDRRRFGARRAPGLDFETPTPDARTGPSVEWAISKNRQGALAASERWQHIRKQPKT